MGGSVCSDCCHFALVLSVRSCQLTWSLLKMYMIWQHPVGIVSSHHACGLTPTLRAFSVLLSACVLGTLHSPSVAMHHLQHILCSIVWCCCPNCTVRTCAVTHTPLHSNRTFFVSAAPDTVRQEETRTALSIAVALMFAQQAGMVDCRADHLGYDILGKASVQVTKQRKENGSASLSLCHCYDPKSGGHVLRVSCSLWVFNCTGLPIALRQSWLAEGFGKQVHPTLLQCCLQLLTRNEQHPSLAVVATGCLPCVAGFLLDRTACISCTEAIAMFLLLRCGWCVLHTTACFFSSACLWNASQCDPVGVT